MLCNCFRFSVLVAFLVSANIVFALPFNDDMVDVSLSTGKFSRARVKGTIPNGTAELSRLDSKESVPQDLTNPVESTPESLLKGNRLFAANCSSCHGNIEAEQWTPGVSGALMGAPNISDKAYERIDASYYSTIRFGNIIMPALGWKLSDAEVWDVVNYLRNVQSKKNK